jgi:hypothetical protein
MVKQSVLHMRAFFSPERFGKPQIIAAMLLLVFLGQCVWLIAHQDRTAPGSLDDFVRIEQGLAQWRGHGIAGTPSVQLFHSSAQPISGHESGASSYDRNHSPLWYLIGSALVAVFHPALGSWIWPWLTHAPYVAFGLLLGASLWYVSRRLYGNPGGYIALALYCFSPLVIRSSVLWQAPPNIGGAWGCFGAVFTAIAVSHTLYAPREVVLWNWRRTVLLGVSLALAVGSHFNLVVILPVLVAFMLYLAPNRKLAAITILGSSCLIALVLLFAGYFFHGAIFLQGLKHASLGILGWRAAAMRDAYSQLGFELITSGPVLVVLVPLALATFIAWPRTRYFGNVAPLIMAVLFLGLRVVSPHEAGSIFTLAAVIFLFVFIAGIAADLLETPRRELFSAIIAGLIAANSLWELISLARIGR